MALYKNNLSIFGISKVKTLSDFVTTEQDVKKGNNRLPLNLARIYEEDLMTKDEVEKAKVEMKMQGLKIDSNTADDDDFTANMKHKENALRR